MSLRILVDLCNQDLLVLEEMEWNGMKYDLQLSEKLGGDCLRQITVLDSELRSYFPGIPYNLNSPKHVSCLLYGGVLKVRVKKPFEFHYKDGRTTIKERWEEEEYILPRLVEPVTEVGADGESYSVAEDVLKSLKPKGKAKKVIELLKTISLLQTKVERYYHGIPKKYSEKNWQGSIIHGQLNQCVARTSRLSSSDPNMQNMDGEAKQCFISRF